MIVEPGRLTAFDPQTARQRWRVQTGLRQQWAESKGDMLLVSGSGAGSAADPSGAATVAVDAATGEVRWRIAGYLERTDSFLISHEISYSPFPVGRLTVYNQAAQRLWSADPVAPLHALDPERRIVLTVDPTSGEMVEYQLDNGFVVGRTLVPELIGASAIYGVGERMTAQFPDRHSVTQDGSKFVDIPSGSPVIPGEIADFAEERSDCGLVWCVYSSFGLGMRLIDKATGETVHRGEHWSSATRTDFGVVGMTPDFDDGVSTIIVFDSATRRLRKIAGWSLIGIRTEARMNTWHGPIYLVATAPQGTFFAVLDGSGMHIAGSVPYEHLLQCVATTDLVACRVDPQTIKVWHPVA